jgi:hypothetical protein
VFDFAATAVQNGRVGRGKDRGRQQEATSPNIERLNGKSSTLAEETEESRFEGHLPLGPRELVSK